MKLVQDIYEKLKKYPYICKVCLERKIEEKMKYGSDAYVEVSSEGNIISVSLRLSGDESVAIAYIIDTLKVPRERIKLSYENN